MDAYNTRKEQNTHDGKAVAKIREMVGIDYDTIYKKAGIPPEEMIELEKKAHIADNKLEPLARVLGVPVSLIRNFREDKPVYFIQSGVTVHDNGTNHMSFYPIINQEPVDKVIVLLERLINKIGSQAAYSSMVNEEDAVKSKKNKPSSRKSDKK